MKKLFAFLGFILSVPLILIVAFIAFFCVFYYAAMQADHIIDSVSKGGFLDMIILLALGVIIYIPLAGISGGILGLLYFVASMPSKNKTVVSYLINGCSGLIGFAAIIYFWYLIIPPIYKNFSFMEFFWGSWKNSFFVSIEFTIAVIVYSGCSVWTYQTLINRKS